MRMRESSSTQEKMNELTVALEINADIISTLIRLYSASSLELHTKFPWYENVDGVLFANN